MLKGLFSDDFGWRGAIGFLSWKEKWNHRMKSSECLLYLEKIAIFASDLCKNKFCDSMYAIVEIAGRQFKVEKGRKLYVYRLQGDEGSSLSFDKVLLTDNDGQVKIGTPVVEGAVVNATILKHLKDDKVIEIGRAHV